MSERKFLGPVLVAGAVVAGCGSTEPMNMPELQEMQVACVNVEGLPQYSDEGCHDVAKSVEEGFRSLNELTYGTVKIPKVTHKVYPELIEVDKAVERRCTNFNAQPFNIDPMEELVKKVADTALEMVEVDFSNTGVFLAVNAPQSVCTGQPNKPAAQSVKGTTEQCPKGAVTEAVHYGDGRALIESGKPAIIGFGIEADKKKGADLVAHENLHFGVGVLRLGHEIAFCSDDAAKLPNYFGPSPGSVKLDKRANRLSIMGGTLHGANHIALPHLYYLNAIDKNRVARPTQSTEMILKDVSKKEGISLVELPLGNTAVREIVGKTLARETTKVKAEDLVTFIGKMPEQNKLGVYVAPKKEANQETLPIFLVDELSSGEKLTFAGDFELTVKGMTNEEATIQLQMQ